MRMDYSPSGFAILRTSDSKAVSVEFPLLSLDCFGSSMWFRFRTSFTSFTIIYFWYGASSQLVLVFTCLPVAWHGSANCLPSTQKIVQHFVASRMFAPSLLSLSLDICQSVFFPQDSPVLFMQYKSFLDAPYPPTHSLVDNDVENYHSASSH